MPIPSLFTPVEIHCLSYYFVTVRHIRPINCYWKFFIGSITENAPGERKKMFQLRVLLLSAESSFSLQLVLEVCGQLYELAAIFISLQGFWSCCCLQVAALVFRKLSLSAANSGNLWPTLLQTCKSICSLQKARLVCRYFCKSTVNSVPV